MGFSSCRNSWRGDVALEAASGGSVGFALDTAFVAVGNGFGGSQRSRLRTMVWMAWLSLRSPPGLSRTWSLDPDETGMGAVPASIAKLPSFAKRPGWGPCAKHGRGNDGANA